MILNCILLYLKLYLIWFQLHFIVFDFKMWLLDFAGNATSWEIDSSSICLPDNQLNVKVRAVNRAENQLEMLPGPWSPEGFFPCPTSGNDVTEIEVTIVHIKRRYSHGLSTQSIRSTHWSAVHSNDVTFQYSTCESWETFPPSNWYWSAQNMHLM